MRGSNLAAARVACTSIRSWTAAERCIQGGTLGPADPNMIALWQSAHVGERAHG